MEIMDSRERSDTRGKTNFHFREKFWRAIASYRESMQAFASPSAMSCRTCKRGYNAIAQLTYHIFNLKSKNFPKMEIMDSRERSDTRGKTNFHFRKIFWRAKRASANPCKLSRRRGATPCQGCKPRLERDSAAHLQILNLKANLPQIGSKTNPEIYLSPVPRFCRHLPATTYQIRKSRFLP